VTAGQSLDGAEIAMDVELGESVHALELLEAVEWHLGGTRDELQQFCFLFLVEAAHRAPEPLRLWRGLRVVVVVGVVLPVVGVDVRETGDQQLELLFVEDGD